MVTKIYIAMENKPLWSTKNNNKNINIKCDKLTYKKRFCSAFRNMDLPQCSQTRNTLLNQA